ncbi:MAG: hypothetical protein ACRD08_24360, partial [Acidimicrobiales bacterium]
MEWARDRAQVRDAVAVAVGHVVADVLRPDGSVVDGPTGTVTVSEADRVTDELPRAIGGVGWQTA